MQTVHNAQAAYQWFRRGYEAAARYADGPVVTSLYEAWSAEIADLPLTLPQIEIGTRVARQLTVDLTATVVPGVAVEPTSADCERGAHELGDYAELDKAVLVQWAFGRSWEYVEDLQVI